MRAVNSAASIDSSAVDRSRSLKANDHAVPAFCHLLCLPHNPLPKASSTLNQSRRRVRPGLRLRLKTRDSRLKTENVHYANIQTNTDNGTNIDTDTDTDTGTDTDTDTETKPSD